MAGPLKPQVFNCLNCGAPLEINAAGYSQTIICTKCQTVLDVGHPLPKIVRRYNVAMSQPPNIPIGSFGKLKGLKWKAIGYIVREDVQYKVQWKEYLLYNPYYGFRFLFEMDSHFSLIETMNFNPFPTESLDVSSVKLHKLGEFQLYNRGKAKVIFAAGEFFWQVKVGESVVMEDFINPPYMLSVERNSTEVHFSLGEYISASEVATGFGVSLDTPWKIAPNLPNPYSTNFKKVVGTYWIALAILVLSAMLFAIAKPQKLVSSFNLVGSDFNSLQKEFISPPFKLADAYGNVKLDLSSQVNNKWLSTDVVLVNEESGEEFKTETGVEYYSGYDGEYWSEGSPSNSETISSVPGGLYHAEISAETDMPEKTLRLDIRRNGSMVVNFIVTLILISLYPIWVFYRRRTFEVSRWENSDFSPYHGPGSLNQFVENLNSSLDSYD